jgi:hypothetical protein
VVDSLRSRLWNSWAGDFCPQRAYLTRLLT